MIGVELEVGTKFKIDGVDVITVASGEEDCEGCLFELDCNIFNNIECASSERSDGKSVKFVKVD